MSEQTVEFHRFALKFVVVAILAAAEPAVLHGLDPGAAEAGHAEWVRNVPVFGLGLPFI